MTYRELLECLNNCLKPFKSINNIDIVVEPGIVILTINIFELEYIAEKLMNLDIIKALKDLQLSVFPISLDMDVKIIYDDIKKNTF
jgi:hypothetical protein